MVAARTTGGSCLRACRPLVAPSDDLERELAAAARRDYQPAPPVGGIRLGVARGAERHQAVELEVRAPLGALDDVVDLGDPSAAAVSTLCT